VTLDQSLSGDVTLQIFFLKRRIYKSVCTGTPERLISKQQITSLTFDSISFRLNVFSLV